MNKKKETEDNYTLLVVNRKESRGINGWDSLCREVTAVETILVIHLGHHLATAEPAVVQGLDGLVHLRRHGELHEDLDDDVRILLLALLLLVNDDPVDRSELAALLGHLSLQVVVDVLRAHHVAQNHDCGLEKRHGRG